MIEDFAVFILSYGRPDRVFTYDTLRLCGYTGPIYIVNNDKDKTGPKYRSIYGEQVVTFDLDATAEMVDEGDNSGEHNTEVYVRNAIFEIARQKGLTYFVELDDDYTGFIYKTDAHFQYRERPIRNLDRIFAAMLDYYWAMPALCLAMAQCGDFIGGAENKSMNTLLGPRRKAMNVFICSTERPFPFLGRMNDDVNTYTSLGNRGGLFLTFPLLAIHQKPTQKGKGGLTEVYQAAGTYVKSFYTVMYVPSGVSVREMGEKHKRLHHSVVWNNTVPCIIPESYRKADHAGA